MERLAGTALRAVRPPNLYITPVVRRDLVYAASATGSLYRLPLTIIAQTIRAIFVRIDREPRSHVRFGSLADIGRQRGLGPHCPRKQTSGGRIGMSAKCHKQTTCQWARSFTLKRASLKDGHLGFDLDQNFFSFRRQSRWPGLELTILPFER